MPNLYAHVTRVVMQATISPDQSERSKFVSTNQNQAYSPRDQNDVTSSQIWASKPRDPMRKRTPHSWHSFIDRAKPGDKWDACAVQPQSPRIPESP